jgi:hypothetical protein
MEADAHEVPTPALSWRTLAWLSGVLVATTCGLYLIAASYDASRAERPEAGVLYWLGMLLLLSMPVLRLTGRDVSRGERLVHLVLLAAALPFVKILQSPTSVTYHDELIHWSVVEEILASGRLFAENAILPVSPYYPGLHIVTEALVSVSGLSLFSAAMMVVVVARVLLAVALFLTYEQIGRNAWLAGLGVLVYMGNPNFVYFDSQFAYETFALPIAATVLFLFVCRQQGDARDRVALTVVALAGVGAVAVSHHLTIYALVALMIAWSVVYSIVHRSSDSRPFGPVGAAILVTVVAFTWIIYVATLTAWYLGSNIVAASAELFRLLAGEVGARALFGDFSGGRAPLGDRIGAYVSVLLVLAALPIGLRAVWRQHRHEALALTLAVAALAYPVTLAMRLTNRGLEPASRSWEFLFVALGMVVAAGFTGPMTLGRLRLDERWRRPITSVALTVVIAGGVALGWPFWLRMPGPYLVSADMRSIEPESLSLATWFAAEIRPGSRVAADRVNRLLLTAYGRQRAITAIHDRVNIAPVLMSEQFDDADISLLQRTTSEYLVVDRRLADGLPMVGVYVELDEPGTYSRTAPISAQALAKFDAIPIVSRLFDSGHLQVYDMRPYVYGR